MSVITISRCSYSRGKEVAEKVAHGLGYECISREVLLEASEQFNIPEIKLIRAIHDAPSILDRFAHGKEQYIAFIRAALLKHIQKDNVVYHGLAGHFFLQGIPHVLMVRVTTDINYRVWEEMKRENISAHEARHILKKDDDERRRWSLFLYGKDPCDSDLYDLVARIRTKSVDDAVGLILYVANQHRFETTPESQKMVDNLSLAAQVKAALANEFPFAQTCAKDGKVFVNIEAPPIQEREISTETKNVAEKVDGVKDVEVHVVPWCLDIDH